MRCGDKRKREADKLVVVASVKSCQVADKASGVFFRVVRLCGPVITQQKPWEPLNHPLYHRNPATTLHRQFNTNFGINVVLSTVENLGPLKGRVCDLQRCSSAHFVLRKPRRKLIYISAIV